MLLKEMLSAHFGRKIMGGNEHDYRMTANVWQEEGEEGSVRKWGLCCFVGECLTRLLTIQWLNFLAHNKSSTRTITSECLLLLRADCITSLFQS